MVSQEERTQHRAAFSRFVKEKEAILRATLVAHYGAEVGREATAEALAWAWEHWERLQGAENPAGYLYRVGRTKARRSFRRRPLFPHPDGHEPPWVEPGLAGALERLTPNQRMAVVLVHAYGLTHQEVAEILGVSRSTVQNHLERGLAKLRRDLGGEGHA